MKYIKRFNEDNKDTSLESVIRDIKEEWSEISVCQLFDEELLEWVDDDWQDEYESEYDWYMDHNNGEAQDVIINQIVDWAMNNCNISNMDISELISAIKSEYDCLYY